MNKDPETTKLEKRLTQLEFDVKLLVKRIEVLQRENNRRRSECSQLILKLNNK